MAAALTVDEVRLYASDYIPKNLLIDGEEFTDEYIAFCISLGVDAFDSMPPFSNTSLDTFPSKSLLLFGTCWHMFDGRAMLVARNTMNYSDGGLQIPIEERFELYRNLATNFMNTFTERSKALKIHFNMESGWGGVGSDLRLLPIW